MLRQSLGDVWVAWRQLCHERKQLIKLRLLILAHAHSTHIAVQCSALDLLPHTRRKNAP